METKENEFDDLRERAEHEYPLSEKQERLRLYIKANLSITDFAEVCGVDMWLREVLKDVDSENPFVRRAALQMWGRYLGILTQTKQKTNKPIDVDFKG